MNSAEVSEWLTGRVVERVEFHEYMGWPMCVDSIIFTDGSSIELSGNADEARVEKVVLPDGQQFPVNNEDLS